MRRTGPQLWPDSLLIVNFIGIEPFCLEMENGGRRMHCWHHTDYGEQYRLHYYWDQPIKKVAYIAPAKSWREVERPPTTAIFATT